MALINTTAIQNAHREAFSIQRQATSAPTMDIVRMERTGADPTKGIKGTLEDTGIQDVECTWRDLTVEEARERGLQADSAVRIFAAYDLTTDTGYPDEDDEFVVRLTDQIRYPATTGKLFNITSVNTLPSGRVEIACGLEN